MIIINIYIKFPSLYIPSIHILDFHYFYKYFLLGISHRQSNTDDAGTYYLGETFGKSNITCDVFPQENTYKLKNQSLFFTHLTSSLPKQFMPCCSFIVLYRHALYHPLVHNPSFPQVNQGQKIGRHFRIFQIWIRPAQGIHFNPFNAFYIKIYRW